MADNKMYATRHVLIVSSITDDGWSLVFLLIIHRIPDHLVATAAVMIKLPEGFTKRVGRYIMCSFQKN